MRTRYITLIGILTLALAGCSVGVQQTIVVETGDPTATHIPVQPTLAQPTPTPTPPPSPMPDESAPTESLAPTAPANPAVAAAVAHLVAELGLSPADVTILSVEEMQWSDSSLGCPQPGMMYAQVITPGYRVLLEADGETHAVHTNQNGSTVVICDLPTEEFSTTGVAFKILLAHLIQTYPGFGLEQPQAWTSQDITKEALVGSSTWAWRSMDWTLEMTFPVVPEPAYEATLFHREAGTVWSGTLEPDGRVTPLSQPVALSVSVGECDEGITPTTDPEWAKVEITVQDGDIHVEQNLSYVCCAELEIAAGQDGDVIKLIETNVGEICRCMCGYPVTARLADLPAGTYTVEVWGVQRLGIHALELLGSAQVQVP